MPGGKPKSIRTPEKLLELWHSFLDWIEENPRYVNTISKGEVIKVAHKRPLTWSRFDTWLYNKGIIHDLEDYRLNRDGRYGDYGGVITRINRQMYADKFEGAAVGAFNANIIARDLGLADKSKTEHSGKVETGEDVTHLDSDQLSKYVKLKAQMKAIVGK